jgi:hypothetical protein
MTAVPSDVQRQVIHDSPWVSWERVRSGNTKAWIQQIRVADRWLYLVTDENGHNYREYTNDDDCYRIIEEAFPITTLVGKKRNGAIELVHVTSMLTI